ncbi:MAG: TatD family hydrolase [Treponema sp.]|nr:TatD family hydrolase [Treponema sp.]
MFCFDAHNHLCHSSYPIFEEEVDYFCISSFCTEEEWANFQLHDRKNVLKSFGIHPQMFASAGFAQVDYEKSLSLLKKLLLNDEIFAVGEIGFDFFTDEFKKTKNEQEEFWNIQVELALEFKKPIVIHARKSMERIFLDSARLKKLPAVIFHSFAGTKRDALSILNRNVNAFFSFGKHQIFNGKKSSVEMLESFSEFPERIFVETDCPYQTLRNENETLPEEIALVYEKARAISETDMCSLTKKSFDFLMKCCSLR